MEGREVLELKVLVFLRQLLMGGDGILEMSGLDWTQMVQFSLGVSNFEE